MERKRCDVENRSPSAPTHVFLLIINVESIVEKPDWNKYQATDFGKQRKKDKMMHGNIFQSLGKCKEKLIEKNLFS